MVTAQERHLLERVEAVVGVSARRMFGGLGLVHDGVFFALIAMERLYLKVDEGNRSAFDARSCPSFQPFADRPVSLSYREPPEDVVADARRFRPWIEGALDAARRARTRKAGPKRKSARRPGRKPDGGEARAEDCAEESDPRAKIANLGPVSRRNLAAVGVHTLADLRARGSVAVFRAVRERGLESSANLLYALEAALLGLRWDRLPDVVKQNLRERAGIAPKR